MEFTTVSPGVEGRMRDELGPGRFSRLMRNQPQPNSNAIWRRLRGQEIFPGCAARAAVTVTLEKGLTDGWIIGSNESALPLLN